MFFEKWVFQIRVIANEKNVRIWGTEHLVEHNPVVLNSLIVMNSCEILKLRILGPFLS